MKLTIERSALLKSLAHVQSVVERRNTIPILSNVLMEAKDGKLSLTATDMDLTIVDQVGATIVEAGATTAPAHTFYDIVRKLPDGSEVEVSANPDTAQMTLKAGRSTFTLQTLPREDFPASGMASLPQVFGVQVSELKNLIDRTRFAISTEETRYYLNGIYIHATEADGTAVLRAVATDGHRLARFEMPLPEGAENVPGVIVPRKTVNELRKLIDETSNPIEVSLSETKIMFRFDSTVLSSKLIDGTFPDYQRVIPSGNDKSLVLDCKTFSSAVDRVSTISTEKSRAVKISIDGSTMTLSANSAENGSAVEVLEISYEGTALDIGFNSRYLLDIAQQIEGDSAEFLMADAASPTIVRDSADNSALYVLMPMRV
ncbi:DNA polymerase III subunit beta [Kiloniella laminariae]|uniref:Beta sliding clamp n=1 Tax=Kiloniella laminariae TaxID=454162 RepID=A0ABT4LLY0_9PROT|nr:DNA polymerase III subunit beta [Kiloniella laminariae]MCZ4280977.1 DNA polymerase III subunit beta [Kiloniella laminariae]